MEVICPAVGLMARHVRRKYSLVGCAEVGVVQHVEALRPKLHLDLFGRACVSLNIETSILHQARTRVRLPLPTFPKVPANGNEYAQGLTH